MRRETSACSATRLARPLLSRGSTPSQAAISLFSSTLRRMAVHSWNSTLPSSARRLWVLRRSAGLSVSSAFLKCEMQMLVSSSRRACLPSGSASSCAPTFLGMPSISRLICPLRCFLISSSLVACSFWWRSTVTRSVSPPFSASAAFRRLAVAASTELISPWVAAHSFFSFSILSMRPWLLVLLTTGVGSSSLETIRLRCCVCCLTGDASTFTAAGFTDANLRKAAATFNLLTELWIADNWVRKPKTFFCLRRMQSNDLRTQALVFWRQRESRATKHLALFLDCSSQFLSTLKLVLTLPTNSWSSRDAMAFLWAEGAASTKGLREVIQEAAKRFLMLSNAVLRRLVYLTRTILLAEQQMI